MLYTENHEQKFAVFSSHVTDDLNLQGCYAASFVNSRCFQVQSHTLQPYLSNINMNIGPSEIRSFKWILPFLVFGRKTVYGNTRWFMTDVDRWQWRRGPRNETVALMLRRYCSLDRYRRQLRTRIVSETVISEVSLSAVIVWQMQHYLWKLRLQLGITVRSSYSFTVSQQFARIICPVPATYISHSIQTNIIIIIIWQDRRSYKLLL
jgi:hypothetical protein